MLRRLMLIVTLCCLICTGRAPAADAPSVSFRNDVMAVLSMAGCNAGACHGNKNGKGGFRLSLRGQDPEADYLSLSRDADARRVNLIDPDRSLVLLKPTAQVAHQGGLRFRAGSAEYDIIRQWIAGGARRDDASAPALLRLEVSPAEQILIEPADRVQIQATAVFSDGSRRDVSKLCVYEQSTELAGVQPGGLVVRKDRPGETAVVVRYLQCQEVVRPGVRAGAAGLSMERAGRQQLHRFGNLREAQGAADESLRRLHRRRIRPPGVPRSAGHPADAG